MDILRTVFAIAFVAGFVYLRVKLKQRAEETRRRKIHVQTLFPGENDRHLNE